jgi:uncharacterized membrane protein YdcZ (DUF606 family)
MEESQLTTTENMGELLALLFVAATLLISGLILAFTTQDAPRKAGIAISIIGLVIILACIIFYPNSDNYRL